eukprot:TRINITY_DN5516_c0_g1_i1.p1 TRINITY_DN5516_c0_g1~~TRINITY_DN5516_c0_g1_i1.p1  ORF type:complete len:233 (-),score=39.99 TRINITY_DN5516_c0_g1_i1:59-712(-)
MAEPVSQKKIYLIRHGQSKHNEAENAWRATRGTTEDEERFPDPLFFDAELSSAGHEQTVDLHKRVNETLAHAELVVISPLSRAIQTFMAGFQSLRQNIPIHVHPLCREKVENACDIGRPVSELKAAFPELSFEHLEPIWWYTESSDITEDNFRDLWASGKRYEEPEDYLNSRIESFRQWLKERPEQNIVVVGHSNFFRKFTGMKTKLANCEIHLHHL